MVIPESAEPSRNLAQFVAFVALVVGLFVLAGWAFGMDQLTNIVPTWPRVVRLTALSFILSGFALWLATNEKRVPAIIAAALLTAIGALVLI
jgi:cytochrome bd-type quinol oxidase subunit 2